MEATITRPDPLILHFACRILWPALEAISTTTTDPTNIIRSVIISIINCSITITSSITSSTILEPVVTLPADLHQDRLIHLWRITIIMRLQQLQRPLRPQLPSWAIRIIITTG